MKTPEIDLDTSQINILQKQSSLLEVYEGKIQALLQEKIDTNIDETTYEDKKEDLRREFLSEFNNTLKEVDLSTPEIHFKNIMSKALLDQIKRGFGYYEAMMEIRPKINQYNMQLGEEVLESKTKNSLETIEKLERIVLLTNIVKAMKMEDKYADLIINLNINKEFGIKK